METLFNYLRVVHIICGFTAFFVAPVAMIVKKGSNSHRRWGKVFFWCMAGVCFTAIIMAPIQHNLFLTLVAVFSFYLAFSGYRALFRKNLFKTKKVALLDWIVVGLNTSFSLGLIVLGIVSLPNSFGIISIVFGFIGTSFGIKDIFQFLRPKDDKQKWFFNHMGGMIGAYIAALSAFSAVNFNFEWLPTVIQWLWPTIIGVPFLSMWIRKYKMKFGKGRKVRDEADVRIQLEAVE